MGFNIKLGSNIESRFSYLLDQITEKLNKDNGVKLLVVMPEQFNFSCQKMILEKLDSKVISNIEILSFNRLVYRIFEEANYFTESISEIERVMLLESIINEREDELRFFNKYKVTSEIILEINNLVNLITRNMLAPEDLESFAQEARYITNDKIHDLSIIYKDYILKLDHLGVISADHVALKGQINKTMLLDNAAIYISEFYNFTNDQIDMLSTILENKPEIDIEVIMQAKKYEEIKDDEKEININLFSLVNSTIKKLSEKLKYDIKNIEVIKEVANKKEELKILSDMYIDNKYEVLDAETSNISLTDFESRNEEMQNVANTIIDLVKNKGYRYKDITIALGSLDEYKLLTRNVLNDYHIPFFIEDKKDIINLNISKVIDKIITLVESNFNIGDIIVLLKLGLIKNISDEDINKFENEILKQGITNLDDLLKRSDIKIDISNILELLNYIKKSFNKKTLYSIDEITNNFRIFVNLYIKESTYDYFEKEVELVNKVFEVLDRSVTYKLNMSEFFNIYKLATNKVSISAMNEHIDNVTILDSKRLNILETKVLFLAGYSDRGFSINKLTSLFSEKESDTLRGKALEFNRRFDFSIIETRFMFFNTIEKVKDKLYISYVNNKGGVEVKVDKEIIKIKTLFKNIRRNEFDIDYIIDELLNTDESIIRFLEFNFNSIDDSKIKKCLSKIRDTKLLKEYALYNKEFNLEVENEDKDLALSFSKLETYIKCPFAYFVNYNLKARERDVAKLESAEIGSIVHEVLEIIFNEVKEEKIDINKADKTFIEDKINTIINSELSVKYIKNPKNEAMIDRLKQILVRNIINLFEQLKRGEFTVYGTEIPFGKDEELNLEIVLDDDLNKGKTICLNGKIDRVDICKDNNSTYIKIIDYKTGKKKYDPKRVEKGLDLQLLIYADVLSKRIEGSEIAGLFISRIDMDMKKDNEGNLKDNKYTGLVIDNRKSIELMDSNYLESPDVLPVKVTKSGEYAKTGNSVISKKQVDEDIKRTEDKIKEIAGDIFRGDISVRPLIDSTLKIDACKYCLYGNICGRKLIEDEEEESEEE